MADLYVVSPERPPVVPAQPVPRQEAASIGLLVVQVGLGWNSDTRPWEKPRSLA